MTFKETMAELKKMGTAQNVKIYKRHGAPEPLFGVSYANLGKLQKKIKQDHALAGQLWESGNLDAQVLATKIADPKQFTTTQANKWAKSVSCYITGDALGLLVARSPIARERMEQWMKAKPEYARQVGYTVLAAAIAQENEITDADCKRYIKTIEKEIHSSPNRARHSMNMALISLGISRPEIRELVYETAERIGPVNVDHGETSCTTPEIIPYIKRAAARTKKKKARTC